MFLVIGLRGSDTEFLYVLVIWLMGSDTVSGCF